MSRRVHDLQSENENVYTTADFIVLQIVKLVKSASSKQKLEFERLLVATCAHLMILTDSVRKP